MTSSEGLLTAAGTNPKLKQDARGVVDLQSALASYPERSLPWTSRSPGADQAQAGERGVSARSDSGLNKDKRDGGQRQQDPSDTEDSYQPEVELDVGAARYCALKAALTVRANRGQSDSQACIADA
jgi:hypothetical protein